jgi:hypothetical protein
MTTGLAELGDHGQDDGKEPGHFASVRQELNGDFAGNNCNR